MRVIVGHNRYRSETPSGEDRVVDQEVAALRDAGHEVELFERFSDHIASASLAQRALVPVQVVWSDRSRRSLRDCIRRFRPDVVHLHNTFPLVSPAVLFACASEGVPVVATLHNYRLVCPSGDLYRDGASCHDCLGRMIPLPGVRHGCYRNSMAATLPVAAGVVLHRRNWRKMVSAFVLLSRAQRNTLVGEGLPAARSFVKPNLVPVLSGPSQGPKDDLVVYAGRLNAPKGVPFLMEAWDRHALRSRTCRLRLALAGVGPLEAEVAAWAAHRPRVEWLGSLGRAECASLIAGARAVIVPSQWEEAFGLVAAEAMSLGVPPLASARAALPEIVTHGVDGMLFDADNPESLAMLLADIEERPARYEALGEAARRTHRQQFAPAVNLARLLAIYEFAAESPVDVAT